MGAASTHCGNTVPRNSSTLLSLHPFRPPSGLSHSCWSFRFLYACHHSCRLVRCYGHGHSLCTQLTVANCTCSKKSKLYMLKNKTPQEKTRGCNRASCSAMGNDCKGMHVQSVSAAACWDGSRAFQMSFFDIARPGST